MDWNKVAEFLEFEAAQQDDIAKSLETRGVAGARQQAKEKADLYSLLARALRKGMGN